MIRPDSGSGSVLGISLVAVVIATLLLLVPFAAALELKRRVASTADAAALAAADVASGALPGVPCREAARVARALGTALDGCVVDGVVATVRVSGALGRGTGVLAASAVATAGPPREGLK